MKKAAIGSLLHFIANPDLFAGKFFPDHIQRTAFAEPLDLLFIVGVIDDHFIPRTVFVVEHHGKRFAGSKCCQSQDIY